MDLEFDRYEICECGESRYDYERQIDPVTKLCTEEESPLSECGYCGNYFPTKEPEENYRQEINWVIVGGESGSGARPMNIQWIRRIIADCKNAGVRCFVKQLGSEPRFMADEVDDPISLRDKKGGDIAEWPFDLQIREFPTT